MNITKYSVPEFKNKQNIKVLLAKIGVSEELWDNGGENFWNQSFESLTNILQIARKLYKDLAKQIHPRTLEDSDEEAKKLHSLMDAIEQRFEYKLNRKLFPSSERRDGKIECECGCGRFFTPVTKYTNEKKYYSKKCRFRAKWKREKARLKMLKPALRREDFPLVECPCGCGVRFRKVTENGRTKKFFSPKCRKRAKDRRTRERLRLLKPEYPLVTCACGCGKEFRQTRTGGRPKKFFSSACKNKNRRPEYPLVTCACGCGKEFRQKIMGRRLKKFFSCACKNKFFYAMRKRNA